MPDIPVNRALLTWRKLMKGFGEAASWIYFFIGIAVAYEIVARYLFNSPTHWVEEMSRVGIVWATFGLLAPCLNQRQMIAITLLRNNASPRVGFSMDLLQLVAMFAVGVIVGWFAFAQMMQSIEMGRSTATTLSLPYWVFHLALVVGFSLFALQAAIETIWLCLSGERLFDAEDNGEMH